MTTTTSPTRCTSCGCNAVQRNGFCNWCGHDHNPADPVTPDAIKAFCADCGALDYWSCVCPPAPAPVTGRYGGWPTKDEYVNLQTGEILPRPAPLDYRETNLIRKALAQGGTATGPYATEAVKALESLCARGYVTYEPNASAGRYTVTAAGAKALVTRRVCMDIEWYYGHASGHVAEGALIIDVLSSHAVGTREFETDALQAAYDHTETAVITEGGAGVRKLTIRVGPQFANADLTPEREY